MTNADYNPEFDPVDVDGDYGSTGGDITVPTFNQVKPFRFWCQKALPLVYDDSLSYYELLCRVVAYLNNMMTDLNSATSSISEFAEQFVTNQTFLNNMAQQLGDNTEALEDYINERMEDFSEAYQELEDYVNNYFNNLDVQEEIDNKLDEMSTDGTFDEIFLPFVSGWITEKTEQIDNSINNQNQTLAQQNGKIAVLEGRMDTFSQLPAGSTSANAELADIRTNFLGVTFANAGDAVRTSDFIASGYNSIPVEASVKDLFLDGSEVAMNGDFSTYSVDITPFKGGKLALIFNAYSTFNNRVENAMPIFGKSNVMTPAIDGCTTFDIPVSGSLSILKTYTLTSGSQTSTHGYKYLLILPIPKDETYRYYYLPYTQFGEGDPSDPSYVYPPDGTYLPNRIVYATSWYATPVDATLTHSGEGADAKVTGDKLTEIKSALTNYVRDAYYKIDKSVTYIDAYVTASGVVSNSTTSKTGIFNLKKGETVIVGTANSNICMLGITSNNNVDIGDTITPIYKTPNNASFFYARYTAIEDTNVVVCYKSSNFSLEFYGNNGAIEKATAEAQGLIVQPVVCNGSYTMNGAVDGGGYITTVRTNVIPFSKGDKITINNGTLTHAVAIWKDSVSSANNTRYDSSYSNNNETIIAHYNGYIVVVFKKSDNSIINISNYDGKVELHKVTYTSSEVNNILGAEPPVYYFTNDYLKSKTARINELAEQGDDAFVFITDIHWERNAKNSPDLISYINKKCSMHKLFNGGDTVDNLSVSISYKEYQKPIYGKVRNIMGNHDWFYPDNGKTLYYYMDSMNNDQIGSAFDHYWYVDNVQQKIRYITLNAFTHTGNNNSTGWSNYDETQIAWFSSVALDVPTDWDVIVFTHYLKTSASSVSGSSSIETAIDAFNANTSRTGKILGVFQGHTHWDAIYHTSGGVPVITTTCDKWDLSNESTLEQEQPGRVLGTISEQAFDVVVLNRAQHKFTCVRIGALAQNNIDKYRTDPTFEWIGTLEEREVSYV